MLTNFEKRKPYCFSQQAYTYRFNLRNAYINSMTPKQFQTVTQSKSTVLSHTKLAMDQEQFKADTETKSIVLNITDRKLSQTATQSNYPYDFNFYFLLRKIDTTQQLCPLPYKKSGEKFWSLQNQDHCIHLINISTKPQPRLNMFCFNASFHVLSTGCFLSRIWAFLFDNGSRLCSYFRVAYEQQNYDTLLSKQSYQRESCFQIHALQL